MRVRGRERGAAVRDDRLRGAAVHRGDVPDPGRGARLRQVWLCPSRGRPHNVARLRSAWGELTHSAELLIAVDKDDPQLPAYADGGEVTVCPPLGLGGVINWLAQKVAPLCNHIGFLGDDHCPRTPGWDRMLTEALDGRLGVAYGDDLLLGELVPTAALMS